MNALTGDSKYIDVLEKSLYNGALDGLSLSGDRFFYGNPLTSTGKGARREWFGTACCPANIARLIASLGDYVYARNENGIWINLFVGSDTKINMGKTEVGMKMETNYPLDGAVKINIDPAKPTSFALHIRKPGWCSGTAVPGNLYNYTGSDAIPSPISITVNGKPADVTEANGYYIINRNWRKGDVVEYDMTMKVKEVQSREEIKTNQGRIALQRGPLLYCVEGADNDGKALNIIFPENTVVKEESYTVLNEKVVALKMDLPVVSINADGLGIQTIKKNITAIPYYTWCNRGKNQMQVWLPQKITDVKLNY